MSRIVFMGTPEFAVPSLREMCRRQLVPVAVVTAPDRERGRGRRVSASAVKEAAVSLGITTILQPESVGDDSFSDAFRNLDADILVVVAFRILPPAIFSATRMGSFNLHGSLLPAFRGAAPIHRAVMAGETETGVTTFFLKEKVDTGQIILQRPMPIGPDETTGEVHDRMKILGAEVVVETILKILNNDAIAMPQDDSHASSAPKIFRDDCRIPWSADTYTVHNHIRGLSPLPGAFTHLGGRILKVYRSRVIEEAPIGGSEECSEFSPPGSLDCSGDRFRVRTGNGNVEILELKIEGRRRMSAQEFLNGNKSLAGSVLE